MADETVKPPRGFYKRGKYWWVYKVIRNVRVRYSTHQTTLEYALKWWDARDERAKALLFPKIPAKLRTQALTLYNSAKSRAARNGDEFNITALDIMMLFRRSRNKCQLTGIPFSSERAGLCRRAPFGPSLDRVKADGGYRVNNIRLVCVIANTALGEWGEDVFSKLAAEYLRHKQRHTVLTM